MHRDSSNQRRQWKLLQVEPALACNLSCIMCPWRNIHKKCRSGGTMTPETWEAIRPHLNRIDAIDFTGGGEPLLQSYLVDWVAQTHRAGCETGILTNGVLLTKDKISALIDAGINWIGISMDGADAETYERIRKGAVFDTVCKQVRQLAGLRQAHQPMLMINFVIMEINAHQLDKMVRLAVELGVDQINFKQCDVIREECGRGLGLFGPNATHTIRRLRSRLNKARHLAKKMGLKTTAFAFTPEEQPICDQDPTASMFVGHDGSVSPCINLALGGKTTFLGQDVVMPTIHYGRLGNMDLNDIWQTKTCRFFQKRYASRIKTLEDIYIQRFIDGAASLENTDRMARQAMPPPPEGCKVCHYLYGI